MTDDASKYCGSTRLTTRRDNVAISTSKVRKRRFNEDQLKLLEVTYEAESRPECRTKRDLANEIGLQPGQVAIWFQNRRARSKNRDLERDYKSLRACCDSLASDFDALKSETQSLVNQASIHTHSLFHSKFLGT
ncbi:Homeobox-leucine zipper protein ATHB-7 [Linum grandiflorum]